MRPVRYVATQADVTAGFTPPIPVDYMHSTGEYGLQYQAAAGGAGAGGGIQYSLDDPFNPPANPIWTAIALTAGVAQVNQAVRAFRLLTPILNDILTVVQQGGAPGV